jgi:hypothetical protein
MGNDINAHSAVDLDRVILVPERLRSLQLLRCFSGEKRLTNYSLRLFDKGIVTLGNLHGQALRELNKIARTTPQNLHHLWWFISTNYPLDGTYPATFKPRTVPQQLPAHRSPGLSLG